MRLSNQCFAVTGLGYAPPWTVNAGFVVGGDTTLIVDTGANALAAATIHGYASAVRPSNAVRVLNTEKHFDHIGGNSFFRDLGVPIWGHAGIARTEVEFAAEQAEFNDAIANRARRAFHEERVFFHATSLANPDQTLDRDTVFDLGAGCEVQVLLTPGHTATNVSVWVPADEVLFTGDCLINGYAPNLDAGRPKHWGLWLKSLDRIEALAPKVILAGHGPVARGGEVRTIIATVRRVLEESLERRSSPTAQGARSETAPPPTAACLHP